MSAVPGLKAGEFTYRTFRHVMFARSADDAHRLAVRQLVRLDRRAGLCRMLGKVYRKRSALPTRVGSVTLDSPLVLAAGLVKGDGFATQEAALRAVAKGRNIIPGWRSVPAVLGPVEMGSFTPRPRLGNPGRVLWRATTEQTLLNRVGLRNPGAAAAAAFLGERSGDLPAVYGISVASDAAHADPARRVDDLAEATGRFTEAGLRPSWVTVNISCPNVPGGRVPAEHPGDVTRLCRAVRDELPAGTALWVKTSPGMSAGQHSVAAEAAAEGGAEAVVATNTAVGRLSDSGTRAGVSGEALRPLALRVVDELAETRRRSSRQWDIVGCGGVLNGGNYRAFRERGAAAVQYWTALVFRGPAAAGLILSEANNTA